MNVVNKQGIVLTPEIGGDIHLGSLAKKQRVRSAYSFANINLLGKCNVDCYFCLGKDLELEFEQYQDTQTHFLKFPNFQNFIDRCKELQIPQIYITGQNTDSLLYRHLDQLIDYLQLQGFKVGLRTNGLLAHKMMDVINKCDTCWGDAVSYSIHTLNLETQKKIWKTPLVPNWDFILKNTTAKMRVAIVVTRYNYQEIDSILQFLSNYKNVEYVQVRKICTDTRYNELVEDMELFEQYEKEVAAKYLKIKTFESASVYGMYGMEVSFWRTVGTTVNSINYFSNGILSDDYFIIEGYQIEKGLEIGSDKYVKIDLSPVTL